MNCEIEFMAVGEASKAGDAIVIRYGTEDDFRLMLVDGGHAETGEAIVTHLRAQFGADVVLEHVVLTHSDADHASGLRTVLEEIEVTNLWLHVPWLLAEEARSLFLDRRWTKDGLRDKIQGEYDIISEILDLGSEAGCNLYYPFQGGSIGPFRILSPHRNVYKYLLPQFEKTPAPDQAAIEAANMWIGKQTLASKLLELAKASTQAWTKETWDRERLQEGGITSASNESSVVLYGEFANGRRVLLTGDAGINGLTWAADEADRLGLPLQKFSFVQVPHHGSRRNVGPGILTRLLGPKRAEESAATFSAYVSSPKVEDRHPRRIVLNAFKRRGGTIIKTNGTDMVHQGGFARRKGYNTVEGLPFYSTVEDYT